jgi:probable phosphoglycerate mutase
MTRSTAQPTARNAASDSVKEGWAQAARLAERLATARIAAVYSSPLERARETAEAVARPHGLAVGILGGAVEIDFGDWTGRTLAELAEDPRWRRFNTFRSATRIPGGEMMPEVQARIVAALEELRLRHGDATVAVVSHGDVIKSAVCHYAGIPLDLLLRLEVEPASVTAVTVAELGARILSLNDTGRPAAG